MESYTAKAIEKVAQKGTDALEKDDTKAALQYALDCYGMLRHRELACKITIFTCKKENRKKVIYAYFDAFGGRLLMGVIGIPLFWLIYMLDRKFSFAKPKE